jgi:5-methylcytosine-specific restriction endonuclease McrA
MRKSKLKRKRPIRVITERKQQEMQAEAVVRRLLYIKQKGKCALCGGDVDWRGYQKHERKKRSQGGDPTDINNCVLICGRCHSLEHGIKEVT